MGPKQTPAGRVGFLIVGSARSGTTLLQRLACEIPGVGMPPETHFFSSFAADLVHRRVFPLAGSDLREELERFSALDTSKAIEIDQGAIIDDLSGVAASPFEMFESIVRALAGPAELLGEKTPGHLLWWPAIASAAPLVRFVVVVRDPRAVVASNLSMSWAGYDELSPFPGRIHLPLAARWQLDQQSASAMLATLGSSRCLLLRYEDVVADHETTRHQIGSFLGRDALAPLQTAPTGIVLPWEPWKQSALNEVTSDRVTAWGDALAPQEADQVVAICRRGMRQFGYTQGRPGAIRAARIRARIGPRGRTRPEALPGALPPVSAVHHGYSPLINRFLGQIGAVASQGRKPSTSP